MYTCVCPDLLSNTGAVRVFIVVVAHGRASEKGRKEVKERDQSRTFIMLVRDCHHLKELWRGWSKVGGNLPS